MVWYSYASLSFMMIVATLHSYVTQILILCQ